MTTSHTPSRTAPAAPRLIRLQCSDKFDHTWGEQMTSSVGPINVSPTGEVEVPVNVAAKLLARRPDGEAMFTPLSTQDTEAIADFQLDQAGVTGETATPIDRTLVYIEVPSMSGERMMARDPETEKQVPVEFDEDGVAVVTSHIYAKMRPSFGGDGKSTSPEAPLLFFRGEVGATGSSSASPYFEDDAPSSGPVGAPRLDGQDDLVGVEVEDTDFSRPEAQITPAAKLIAEFNGAPPADVAPPADTTPPSASTSEGATPPGGATTPPTDTATSTDTHPPSSSAFLETLKAAIGAPAVASLKTAGLGTEAEIRAASKEQLQTARGIGDGKTFAKLWSVLHPESNAPTHAPTDTAATTPAT